MGIGVLIDNLLNEAVRIDKNTVSAENLKIIFIITTPEGEYKSLGVDAFSEYGDFVSARTTDYNIKARFTPDVYINKILPFKDNLKCQVISATGIDQIVKEFIPIPTVTYDVRAEGNNSNHANIEGASQITIQGYQFQLLEVPFSKLKDIERSRSFLMANVQDVISYVIDEEMKTVELDNKDKYKGLVMEVPVDNTVSYRQILIPEGIRLINIPVYLQESEHYGVYSKGLGCYYKQNRWWIYSLYDLNKYDTHPRPIEITRLPRDKAPTLQKTFFFNENGLNIVSTGENEHIASSDINKQNTGVGNRIKDPKLISGEQGSYYNNGRAVRTRVDSLTEYQTSQRGSGEEYVPLSDTPSSNTFKYASANSANDGALLTIEWHNSDTGYLEPGAPVRYQFMGDSERMETRKGVLLGYRTDYKVIDPMTLFMKRATKLFIFISK